MIWGKTIVEVVLELFMMFDCRGATPDLARPPKQPGDVWEGINKAAQPAEAIALLHHLNLHEFQVRKCSTIHQFSSLFISFPYQIPENQSKSQSKSHKYPIKSGWPKDNPSQLPQLPRSAFRRLPRPWHQGGCKGVVGVAQGLVQGLHVLKRWRTWRTWRTWTQQKTGLWPNLGCL